MSGARGWLGPYIKLAARAVLLFLAMSSLAQSPGRSASPPQAAASLPRIGIRNGEFIDTFRNRPVLLRGFNYIKLRPNPQSSIYPLHDTFNPHRYSARDAEKAFAELQANGYNLVRVFIDGSAGPGIAARTDGAGFSNPYVRNFLDFLSRARNHHVYVYASVAYTPSSAYFYRIIGSLPPDDHWPNAAYLHPSLTAAKVEYLRDLVNVIKAHDPDLLSNVFAYEAENEVNLAVDHPPFSMESTFSGGGRVYNLKSTADLQELADTSITRWADACADAVHQVDPQALVSASVFTPAAVGRTKPRDAWFERSVDPRVPFDPAVLAHTRLSFVDIHLYPVAPHALDHDLDSLDWNHLKATCKEMGKPLLMGEFGMPTSRTVSRSEAAELLKQHVQRVLDLGFQGYLMWHYDCVEDKTFHNARERTGEIFRALKGMSASPRR